MIPELVASVATFAITTLWLGPCDIVYLWSALNCFGLNFELWVQKLAERRPLAQIEVSRVGHRGQEDLGRAQGGVGGQGALLLSGLVVALSPAPSVLGLTSDVGTSLARGYRRHQRAGPDTPGPGLLLGPRLSGLGPHNH